MLVDCLLIQRFPQKLTTGALDLSILIERLNLLQTIPQHLLKTRNNESTLVLYCYHHKMSIRRYVKYTHQIPKMECYYDSALSGYYFDTSSEVHITFIDD